MKFYILIFWRLFQLVKAGLVLGLFGGTQKYVNDKVSDFTASHANFFFLIRGFLMALHIRKQRRNDFVFVFM